MIPIIDFKEKEYPKFQSSGFASRFAIPFAFEVCKGNGIDIGYSKPEWKYPKAIGIDDGKICSHEGKEFNDPNISALSLPGSNDLDFIFSSHCLEHLPNWVDALDHWSSFLKNGGVMFLYLPDFSQEYWRPFHNRKHIHSFTPEIIGEYFKARSFNKIFVSGVDLNSSFIVMAEK